MDTPAHAHYSIHGLRIESWLVLVNTILAAFSVTSAVPAMSRRSGGKTPTQDLSNANVNII